MQMVGFQYWFNCPHCPEPWGHYVDDTDTASVTCSNPACGKPIQVDPLKIKLAYLDYLHKQASTVRNTEEVKHNEKLYKLPNGSVRLFSTRLGNLFKQVEHAFGLTELEAGKGR